ncbi:MAG: hypothetical protein QOE77_2828, partial [Blastocatellia bacterium]|nr:hypothetical protein [Blastocatellia bacterium]
MKLSFPRRSMRKFRGLNACLLSLLMFTSPILPIAAVAARNRKLTENSAPLVTKNVAGSIAVSVPNLRGTHATAGRYTNMPFFTPSLTATLADDIGLGAKKNPGDTITYTATITNGGASPADDATGMVFSAILDNATTLVGGSINAQPIAKPDSYTGSGNIPISIAAPGVLTNDVDPMTGTNSGLTVTEVQGLAGNVGVATNTTAVGAGGATGSVNLASTGNFTYEPPPGYVGTDTFTYKTSEGTLTDTNTVTITISNMVWFIKNTGGGLNRGTFSNPFTSIASFNSANALADAAPNPKSGDLIALRTGTYAEADGVNLRNNQKLIGEAVQFNTVFTADSNSSSAYTTFAAGTNTAPTVATSAGNGIDLASGNTVRGLNVGNTPGFFGFNGTVVGSPVINTVAKTGTGGAINISTSGAFGANVTFATLESSSSPGANINLVGVTGTLGITSSGAGLTGSAASSNAINISGGSVGFTYAANVTKNNLGSLLNVSGGHTGTLVFNTGTLSATAGDGLQFNNADGIYNFNGTTTLNGGDAGVDIIGGSDGAFSFAGTSSITDPSGTSFNINGGTGNVTYNGTITDDVGVLVSVVNTTGGTKSFTGAITDGDDGDGGAAAVGSINLDNNDGATITFSGGLLVNTGANGGFWAINGGTVNVCAVKPCSGGAAVVNKVTSTTGRTVRVEGTDFGTNGLTFQRIASSGAQNGIRIDTTGASGFFTVTGTGADDSGGSIVNSTQDGVFLNSTRNITLNEMVINNSGQSQIDAATVNGLTLTGVETDDSADHGILGSLITTLTVSGCVFVRGGDNAGIANKDGVFITNLMGTSSVTNTTFSNSNTIQMNVLNTAATVAAPAEPTDVLTVSGTTWNQHTGPFAGDHLSVQANTGGNFKLIVNSTSGINTFTTGGTAVQAASGGSGTVKASVTGVRATAPMTAGVVIGATASSNAKFDIFSNKIANGTGFSGMGSVSIAVTCVTSGSCNGFIRDNTITHTAGAGVDASHVILQGNGTVNAEVFSNVVSGNFQRGFYGSSGSGSGTVNMNFHNNTYTGTANAAAGALQGVYIEAGNSAGGPSSQVCLDMAANSVTMVDTTAYRLRNEVTAGNCAGCVFKLKNYLGGGTDTAAISSWITGAPNSNTLSTTSGTPISIGTNNPYSNGSGGCPAPVFLRAAPGGVEAVEPRRTVGSSYLKEAAREGLTQFELDGIFGAAIQRWEATGLTTEQINTMRSLKFEIADLPGAFLGETNSDRILIDRDAGGRGWYLGADSLSDSLFNNTVSTTRRYTDPKDAPAGQIDLLTAVEHEIGHQLGLDDSYLEKDRDSIMYGYLTVGERRVPARGQARGMQPGALKGSHFLSLSNKRPAPKSFKRATGFDEKLLGALSGETVTVNGAGAGFTLPGGDSITITFQATVNTPPTARSMSVQGKVSGTNFTLVNGITTASPNTNDPETAAVNDATVTNINTVSTWTGATSTDWK